MVDLSRRPLSLGAVAALGLAVGCAMAPQRARAEVISQSLEGTTLVYGTESDVYSFNAPGPGTLEFELKDLGWPKPLQSLSGSVMSSTGVLGSLSSGGVLDVSIGQQGLFYAYVTAKAGTALGLNLGMYSYEFEFRPSTTPVPLPSAIRLILSGLTLIGIVRGVRREPLGKLPLQPAVAA